MRCGCLTRCPRPVARTLKGRHWLGSPGRGRVARKAQPVTLSSVSPSPRHGTRHPLLRISYWALRDNTILPLRHAISQYPWPCYHTHQLTVLCPPPALIYRRGSRRG
ncbi:hypothetical protein E2C01_026283 [Portunus trituberculatus]|uniref:Uncharacterized protein n=1 Tax=Portunus trituberculatus TaxID=210409 RepID=A0A5B7EI53_PORTR|nr:hypothetical protein [Portunus trituberculatus]